MLLGGGEFGGEMKKRPAIVCISMLVVAAVVSCLFGMAVPPPMPIENHVDFNIGVLPFKEFHIGRGVQGVAWVRNLPKEYVSSYRLYLGWFYIDGSRVVNGSERNGLS
jgi:hypothetical protein